MPDLFISYSRDDSLAMGIIRDNLRKLGFNLWIDIEHLKPGTPQWEEAVEAAILNTDIMLVLCSPAAKNSRWVNIEVTIADLSGKTIVPIWIHGDDVLEAIPTRLITAQHIDMRGRLHPDIGFNELVVWLAEYFCLDIPDYEFTTGAGQIPPIQVINIHGHVEGHVVAIGHDVNGKVNIAGGDITQTTDESPSEPERPVEPTETPLQSTRKPLPDQTKRPLSLPTWAWIGGIGAAVIVAIIGLVALLGNGGTESPVAEEPTQTEVLAAEEATPEASAAPTDEPTLVPPSPTTLPTDEPTPVPATPTKQSAEEPARNPVFVLAETGVSSNGEWDPYIQEFDGVQMALVPAGCFHMGSEDYSDEKPIHTVCFDKPFWIDLYEVTNEQFEYFNGEASKKSNWTEGNHPRELINWLESEAFCKRRSARLPTEAEWEYAARGPDALAYPWGNDFFTDNVVYSGNSDSETWAVGSKPGGVSWVGVYDLSGNVWEWVGSLYKDYPYNPDDGREVSNDSDRNTSRVLRGGSWNGSPANVRAADRYWGVLLLMYDDIGFRCARDYEP